MKPWWKLRIRPKTDAYTIAGAQFVLAAMIAANVLLRDMPLAVRVGATIAMACVAFRNCWRAYKMPSDKFENT